MVHVTRQRVSRFYSTQRFLGLLILLIHARLVQSQGGFLASLFTLFGRPCNKDADAERCGSGYVMKIGAEGTIDCQDKCAMIPLLNFGYTCGSCGPITTRAPSSTVEPTRAPAFTTAPVETPTGPDAESFEVTIDLVGSTSILSASDRQAFADAAGRWESVIGSGLSDIPKTSLPNGPRFTGCQYPTVIDDVYICVRVAADDGVGGTLGYASPSYQRSSDGLTVAGYVNLDVDDVRSLISAGTFDDVFTHEIGHILGIGTYFVENGVAGTDSQKCPYYGIKASEEIAKISTCDIVPLENNGKSGDGTYCSHWAEGCLKHELMTGIINFGGNNPLSRITVGSLEDLGYTNLIYSAADTYTAADLGSGCNCRRRSLIESSPLLRSLVHTLADDILKDRPRKLNEETRAYAYQKGLNFLQQDPTNAASVVAGLLNTTTGTTSLDSEEATYVGNRMVSVLVQDGPDGDIYGVHVYNPNFKQ